VLTNLGKYQDSKHLHWHVSAGEPQKGTRKNTIKATLRVASIRPADKLICSPSWCALFLPVQRRWRCPRL
jgi:diadenosine tetraphosphate (Ap4A) HIT family hydrolase